MGLPKCRYNCMVDREKEREAVGNGPVKYHGKWPFERVFGIQEPASVAFFALNLATHFHGWLSFFILLYYNLPLRQEICRARESVTVKEGLASLNRTFGTANPGHLLDLKTSTATGNNGPFVVELKLRCLESNILRCEVEIGSEIGKLLLTSSGPFVVKLNLRCLESNILRCEVEIGYEIGKLLLTSSGPFVVKLNLRCLKSNILRCEVEIGSEIEKLLLTSSGPFVVKLNLCCLECHDILRRGVKIADVWLRARHPSS
ncbi:hypothetical protein F3Y22_tig00111402pilonHSYRG00738 [Hibiscus syriacus]|uniref:Post-GPI attachment to proteins factor 3 n=1 Tax=Hibiscus syriacus TaxID=106335 RepID=A0A6A2YLA2_HIBSY|nr:hypothetical protein F3Y22_tig00111402pilonHSYRG00738 [Hibiscus syriacus]